VLGRPTGHHQGHLEVVGERRKVLLLPRACPPVPLPPRRTLGNKKQALNDFNICINLDEKYANAYLERAKLLFSTEQAPKALEDLRRLKELDPTADTKLHEFCLYYLYREYDLA
jgi:tetratricopeptide (TPR) repeat protein